MSLNKPVKHKKPRKKMTRPEEGLQRAVMRHLLFLERYTKNIMSFHPANELLREENLRKIYAGLGVRSGVPDIVIMLRGGKTVFIELKAGKKKATDKQEDFAAGLTELGFPWYLVAAMNADDAVNQVNAILLENGFHGAKL